MYNIHQINKFAYRLIDYYYTRFPVNDRDEVAGLTPSLLHVLVNRIYYKLTQFKVSMNCSPEMRFKTTGTLIFSIFFALIAHFSRLMMPPPSSSALLESPVPHQSVRWASSLLRKPLLLACRGLVSISPSVISPSVTPLFPPHLTLLDWISAAEA